MIVDDDGVGLLDRVAVVLDIDVNELQFMLGTPENEGAGVCGNDALDVRLRGRLTKHIHSYRRASS